MPFDEYAVDLVLEKKNFYITLLKKYIKHVGEMEGTYFIYEDLYPNYKRFTKKEAEELLKLEKELNES